MLCIGNYECYNAPGKPVLVFVKLIYVAFWVFVLDLMCKGGYKNFAWFLVLLPIISFILLLLIALGPWKHRNRFFEGMTVCGTNNCDDGCDPTDNNKCKPQVK
jgi:hypothetical protein